MFLDVGHQATSALYICCLQPSSCNNVANNIFSFPFPSWSSFGFSPILRVLPPLPPFLVLGVQAAALTGQVDVVEQLLQHPLREKHIMRCAEQLEVVGSGYSFADGTYRHVAWPSDLARYVLERHVAK